MTNGSQATFFPAEGHPDIPAPVDLSPRHSRPFSGDLVGGDEWSWADVAAAAIAAGPVLGVVRGHGHWSSYWAYEISEVTN